MRLYKILLTGLRSKNFYALADDPEKAYQKVMRFLDKEGWGYESDRDFYSAEIIADEDEYNNLKSFLIT